jgi:hypothetical protein
MAGLIAGLLIGGVLPGVSHGSDEVDAAPRSVLECAKWAEQVLAAPPAGVQFLPTLEDRLAERVSKELGERELEALRRAPGLQRAARAHAVDMLQRGYTSHIGPDGRSATERVGILDRRFIGLTGENLAENVGIPRDAIAELTSNADEIVPAIGYTGPISDMDHSASGRQLSPGHAAKARH